jgi:catechol 2,3-dioxygenase-like lactoylglutathione lyase family enzyme
MAQLPECGGLEWVMQQQISVITLGVADLTRSRRFYVDGFGWKPVFQNDEISFFQMNGLMLGVWLKPSLEADMQRSGPTVAGAYALAHNVPAQADVQPLLDRLAAAGGAILRQGDAPPHGGFRGYVADPDGHAWEIAWNPAWKIDAAGHVTFGV